MGKISNKRGTDVFRNKGFKYAEICAYLRMWVICGIQRIHQTLSPLRHVTYTASKYNKNRESDIFVFPKITASLLLSYFNI